MSEKIELKGKRSRLPPAEVVDLFCGVGALSHGLKMAGLKIVAGYDIDARCKHAFEKNNGGEFFARDVSKLTAQEIRKHFSGKTKSVLAGCAPCQPFSTYKQRYEEDPQWSLVNKFAKLAVEVAPDFVTMENVPALLNYKKGKVFSDFRILLENAGYKVTWSIAKCEDFGVPQKRRRLVVIASRNSPPTPLQSTHSKPITVRQAIGKLPKLEAGATHPVDALHSSASLSKRVLPR